MKIFRVGKYNFCVAGDIFGTNSGTKREGLLWAENEFV